MAKGKYAAKAANRVALASDERVAGLEQRIADLDNELASARDALEHERRVRGRLIVIRAEELSARILAEAQKQHAGELLVLEGRMEKAASELCRQWSSGADDDAFYLFAEVLMPLLVPDMKKRSEMVNRCLDELTGLYRDCHNRATRRLGDKRLRIGNGKMQFSDSGDELLARHGHEDALQRLLVKEERRATSG